MSLTAIQRSGVVEHLREFQAMGTEVEIWVHADPARLVSLCDQGERLVQECEQRWSRFRPDSELSQLNRVADRPCIVSPETFRLVQIAVEGWHQTDGWFDPTVGSSMTAAGYDRPFDSLGGATIPEVAEARHLPCPGAAGIRLWSALGAIELADGIQLDLGGIAKGFTADLAVEQLLAAGASGVVVSVGGDIRVGGHPPTPNGWPIQIETRQRHSHGADSGSLIVGLCEGAVCSSTVHKRRWHGPQGAEHHLRNPRTGAPMDSDLASVTIVAATAVQAEILTKYTLAQGLDGAQRTMADNAVTGLVVTADDRIVHLPGLEPFLAAGSAVERLDSQGLCDV